MKKEKINNIIRIILLVFLSIQPIFDLKLFYNSYSTLIRVIVIGVLSLIIFVFDKNKKKYWFLIYFLLLLIYFLFHHNNALNFKSLVPGDFDYNIVSELLYMIKMIMPFLLIYLLNKIDFKYENIKNIIKLIVFSMGGIIIISNIFMFSYGSYSDEIIKGNFLSWFTNGYTNYSYYELASKGLFEFANQIGAVLLMFLPMTLYFSIKDTKKSDVISLIINTFSLILIGTKTSVLGIFIVFIYVIFFYVIFSCVLKKESFSCKNLIIPSIIFLCSIIILPFNPIINRKNVMNSIIQTGLITKLNSNDSYEQQIRYIEENYKSMRIHELFILKYYPYKYDPEFWIGIMKEDVSKRIDYRYLEEQMVKRVIKINDNKYDKYFGITNTRLQNIFNIERDFVVQYYALGIVGLILIIGPYVLFLMFYVLSRIRNRKFNFLDSIVFITIFLILLISLYSGNLLNSLSFTIYFSILYYLLFKDCQQIDKFID